MFRKEGNPSRNFYLSLVSLGDVYWNVKKCSGKRIIPCEIFIWILFTLEKLLKYWKIVLERGQSLAKFLLESCLHWKKHIYIQKMFWKEGNLCLNFFLTLVFTSKMVISCCQIANYVLLLLFVIVIVCKKEKKGINNCKIAINRG